MSNLTITVDDEALRRARLKALEQGTSVNALLREYLEAFAGCRPSHIHAMQALLELSRSATSRSGEQRWTRDKLHERA
jgi:hypothetical protein